jgi:hypothetical protein
MEWLTALAPRLFFPEACGARLARSPVRDIGDSHGRIVAKPSNDRAALHIITTVLCIVIGSYFTVEGDGGYLQMSAAWNGFAEPTAFLRIYLQKTIRLAVYCSCGILW